MNKLERNAGWYIFICVHNIYIYVCMLFFEILIAATSL